MNKIIINQNNLNRVNTNYLTRSCAPLTGLASTGMPSRHCAFATVRTTFSRWFRMLSFCK